MALWLVRTGRHGEFEHEFLTKQRVAIHWGAVSDLSKLTDKSELRLVVADSYPDAPFARISNYTGQLWAFLHNMQIGDWVIVPSKRTSTIHIAEIAGPYTYDKSGDGLSARHYRPVKWLAKDIPRSSFNPDLLYSFGAAMTVCRIQQNDAEQRIHDMASSNWKAPAKHITADIPETQEGESNVDIGELAKDQIARLIINKFKGHGLARLVDAILRAQGYATYLSPEGPDKGIDILAAPGPLGFGDPSLCVQVKSSDTSVDSPTLNQLIGSMQNVHAKQGLLVSWGGFKSSVDKEVPAQFFRVRMWGQKELIEQLLANYDKLDEEIRAELPLKRIWITALEEE